MLRGSTTNIYKGDDEGASIREIKEIADIVEKIDIRLKEDGATSGFEKLYTKLIWEYFGGMYSMFKESLVVMKPGATFSLLVSDSHAFKMVHIQTADLLKLVAEKDSSGRVTVRVELPESEGWRQLPAVNITIRTAALADVHAESMNGAIETVGDLGSLHVDTLNGAINVSGMASALRAESTNGEVRISLADNAAASVDAECTNGRLVLELPASWNGKVNASTTLGTMVVKDIDGTTTPDLTGASFKGTVGSGKGAVASLDVTNGSIEVRTR
jgi:hypothetical protein